MTDSFNRVYGKPDEPFYYGLKPSEEHETISETASFVQHYFDEGELAAWFSTLETLKYEEFMKYDDSHGEPHYHGLARLIGKKPQGKA